MWDFGSKRRFVRNKTHFFLRGKMKIFRMPSSCGRRRLHCLVFARISLATHLLINNFTHAWNKKRHRDPIHLMIRNSFIISFITVSDNVSCSAGLLHSGRFSNPTILFAHSIRGLKSAKWIRPASLRRERRYAKSEDENADGIPFLGNHCALGMRAFVKLQR